MRFSVRRRHVCAGEKKCTLRKSAFWDHTLTEKRILYVGSHGKAHFGSLARARLTEKRILPANLTEKRILQPAGLTENRILTVLKTPERAFP